jgi:hypothetical protein
MLGSPTLRTEEESKRIQVKDRSASPLARRSLGRGGADEAKRSPEAQNIWPRNRFLKALGSRRGDRSTTVPKSGFKVVTKQTQNISRQPGRSGLRDGGRRLQGFQIRETVDRFHF